MFKVKSKGNYGVSFISFEDILHHHLILMFLLLTLSS